MALVGVGGWGLGGYTRAKRETGELNPWVWVRALWVRVLVETARVRSTSAESVQTADPCLHAITSMF
jgi:hypothetical protein